MSASLAFGYCQRPALEIALKVLVAFILGSIALPVLVVIAGVLGWLPSTATSRPPGIESSIASRSLDASLETRARGLKNPIAANDGAALAAGRKLYDGCSGCHGDAKAPSTWGTNDFYPRAPQFFQEDADLTPEEVYAAVHDGIRYSGMAAWGDQIPNDDIWKVANYVARVPRAAAKARASQRPAG